MTHFGGLFRDKQLTHILSQLYLHIFFSVLVNIESAKCMQIEYILIINFIIGPNWGLTVWQFTVFENLLVAFCIISTHVSEGAVNEQ